MQMQQTYYYNPYSPLKTASVGADSNNSSPESVHAECRPHCQQHPQHQQQQQRHHQMMDVASPQPHVPHQQPVHLRRQQQSYQEQHYAQQINTSNGGLVHGSPASDQQRLWHQQLQQQHQLQQQQQPQPQQQQQQPLNGFAGFSSPPVANFVQQPHGQAQLPPSQHQVFPKSYPFVNPAASFAGKQQVAAAARARSCRRKRKPTAEEDGAAKMAKLQVMPPMQPMTSAACDDEHSERLTASMRERQRTQELNAAYNQLRQVIPCMPSDKLSKVQTVRLAAKYIGFLYNMVEFKATPEALRDAHPNSNNALLASAIEVVQSASTARDPAQSQEKLACAFSLWRMGDGGGTSRAE